MHSWVDSFSDLYIVYKFIYLSIAKTYHNLVID
jgi:hypothetical protein